MDNLDLKTLTKKQRKAYFKEERRLQEQNSYKRAQIKKWLIISLIVITALGGVWFGFKEITKPIPGTYVSDLGRDHVPKEKWEKYKYNSNPPTSGSHDADWIRAGVYGSPQGDGHLIHSLEHGYVIISYNCKKKFSIFPLRSEASNFQFSKAYGHEGEEEEASPSAQTGESLGKEWETKECKDLKHKLSDLAEEKRLWKLIVVPRQKMDTAIALTAWTYIDTFNSFDKDRIARFIDAHRDKGPEKTME